MKRKFYISVSSCLVGLLAFTATSCEDWLTVYPQDKVVEEEFWEDKNDLEGVRYGAYHQMAGTIQKLAVWGDLRSDSYNLNRTRHKDMKNYDMYDEIMKGMPDSSMAIFDWGNVYKTINLCNKVLSHGDEVLAKDAQFTTTEWYQMRAEMTALRALNYFYLIRAFKDVPYTTQVINNDRQVTTFGETNQLQILDSIILDCEKVKGQARNRFTRDADSKGMITNAAIYAMLADMYLWRGSLHQGRGMLEDSVKVDTGYVVHTVKGDYQQAADYADLSLASLAKQNLDRFSSSYNPVIIDTENYGLENCDMIENDFTGAYQSTAPLLEAQQYIFTNKNSIESIFELQYSAGEQENSAVNHLYGYTSGSHLEVSQDALGVCYGGWGNAKYDSRMWVGAQNLVTTGSSSSSTALSGYYCVKWQRPDVNWTGQQTSREIKNVQVSSNKWCNWIIYRMTDVMLMKAEALACIGGAANNTLAKNIVNAIHRRSFCNYNESKPVSPDLTSGSTNGNATNNSDIVVMVLNERQIELLGEGKRWFDLVRYAERNSDSASEAADEREATEEKHVGNGQKGMIKMVDTFLRNAYSNYYTTLKNRFKNRYGLYSPIYYMDVKASDGKLHQNPVWNKSKYDQ